jgi:hypothetical protein
MVTDKNIFLKYLIIIYMYIVLKKLLKHDIFMFFIRICIDSFAHACNTIHIPRFSHGSKLASAFIQPFIYLIITSK